ncbi:hypothetical protein NDU88_004192 [Pleurodeles waltl]|uniref:Uncharacterized protein n=1 Tax=Pleurodeles waltl TaxID=8319 RepID=A0AAV7VGD6_PLEWA|nr:hypothetical protein NDU88_004192 [Pleurodeles waltl]
MRNSKVWRQGVGLPACGSNRVDIAQHTSAPCCAYPTPRLVRAAHLLLKRKARAGLSIDEPPAAPRSPRHTLTVLPVPSHRPQQLPRVRVVIAAAHATLHTLPDSLCRVSPEIMLLPLATSPPLGGCSGHQACSFPLRSVAVRGVAGFKGQYWTASTT